MDTHKVFCNSCKQKTNHELVASHLTDGADEYTDWKKNYHIATCRGCEHTSLLVRNYFSEYVEFDPTGGRNNQGQIVNDGWWDELFPNPLSRPEPTWLVDLDDKTLKNILIETYKAIQAGSNYLATFGARTAVDRLIAIEVGDQGSFPHGLAKLKEEQKLSKHEIEVLEPTIEAGHAAAHRGWTPSAEELAVILDVVEGLINRLMILPERANALRTSVPGRKNKKEAANNGRTISALLKKAPKKLRDRVNRLKGHLMTRGDDVQFFERKHYLAFKRAKNFASLHTYHLKGEIILNLNINPDEIELEDGFSRSVRDIGHFGTGDTEIVISSDDDLKKAEPLILKSYEQS